MATAMVPFAGTTEECFEHFIANSVDSIKTMEYVGEFCVGSVDDVESVLRWVRKQYFPGGAQLVRLRFLLHLAGYKITEVNELNSVVRMVSFMVGAGIISYEQLIKELNYAEGSYGPWKVLISAAGYSPGVAEGLNKIAHSRRKRSTLKEFTELHEPEALALIVHPEEDISSTSVRQAPLKIDPAILAAIDRLVLSCSALLRATEDAGAKDELLSLTGDSHLKELYTQLETFLS